MKLPRIIMLSACLIAAHAAVAQTKSETVQYFTEAVRCEAKLFSPANHTPNSSAAAVVVAPGEHATRSSVESFAEAFARRGIVALAIDYRGWGACGGFLYFGEPVRWDDRLRFMQMTTTMKIRRRRLDPKAQIIDIRNAMTFLQSVPGVDRARIGIWGADLAGGHALVTAATDARVKVVVAHTPVIAGKDVPRAAFAPTPEQQKLMIKLARSGAAPNNERAARSLNEEEAGLALAEYRPYAYVDLIPPSTSVLFVIAEKDEHVDNDSHAVAAAKLVKGAAAVTSIAGAKHSLASKEAEAATAASEWFAKHL